MAYAHSKNERGERHDLVAHLRSVGHLAASFADAFGARNTAYWLGLWHDLGKFDPRWQDYLLACEAGEPHGRVDHKAAGTALAFHHCQPLALLIQGHHGGLQAASRPSERGAGIETQTISTPGSSPRGTSLCSLVPTVRCA